MRTQRPIRTDSNCLARTNLRTIGSDMFAARAVSLYVKASFVSSFVGISVRVSSIPYPLYRQVYTGERDLRFPAKRVFRLEPTLGLCAGEEDC
jgi:hypothetical protein